MSTEGGSVSDIFTCWACLSTSAKLFLLTSITRMLALLT